MEEIRAFQIDTEGYGLLKFARPVVRRGSTPWGVFDCLRGTLWGDLIPVVSGSSLSHALHGYLKPLMGELGPHPKLLMRKITDSFCAHVRDKSCVAASRHCYLCTRVPDCYEAPGLDLEQSRVASLVALQWRDGAHVIVVDADTEFNLR
jgi:hypothetical protein